jgi:hypothetical protein
LLTERSIINFLIWTAGLIAAPYLALSCIYGNYKPIGVVMGIAVVAWIFGVLKDGICVFPVIALFCQGRFTFLPLRASLAELSMVALIGYYLISYLALRRKFMRLGPWVLAIPILAIAAIIISDEPNFGIRLLGGGREGGSGALFMILGAAAYVCGVSINTPSVRFLSLLPFYSVIGACIFGIPYVATTYLPATAPFFYSITEQINVSAYSATELNNGGIVREAQQAQLGLTILACILAYFPLHTWWQPKRVWFCLIGAAALLAAVMGGYRSAMFAFVLETVLLTCCYITWRALAVVPVFIFAAGLLVVANSGHYITLPLSAQRTLDFLPGDWDPSVVGETDSSNEFRTRIIEVYLNEYASAHPWLGNGISYDSADFSTYNFLQDTQPTADEYWQSKVFITGKMFHTGWVSVYDAVGFIGSFFYVFGIGVLFYFTGRSVFARSVDRQSPLFPVKAWLFSFTVTQFVSFFVTYGDMKAYFPMFCALAVAWYHINRVEVLGPERTHRREERLEAGRVGLPASPSPYPEVSPL